MGTGYKKGQTKIGDIQNEEWTFQGDDTELFGQPKIWLCKNRQLVFGSREHAGDKAGAEYQFYNGFEKQQESGFVQGSKNSKRLP